MTESLMYLAIGSLSAILIVGAFSLLVVIPLVHGRAVRLTRRRLEAAMPQSMVQIKANKDLLRAEFAMSTRRLEQKIEKLETRNAGQLVELSKKGDAIKHLGAEVHALRDQLRTMKEELDVKASAASEAERALSDRESELAKLRSALDERSTLADWQKAENTALAAQVQTLQGQLTRAREEARAAEARRDAAVRDLSYKESELTRLRNALDERSALVDSQKAENTALAMQVQTLQGQLSQAREEAKAAEARRDAAMRDTSSKESEFAKLRSALDERSAVAGSQNAEIAALTMRVQTLQGHLNRADEQAKAAVEHRDAAVRDLSEKDSKLAGLISTLNERSGLVDSQKAELTALKMELQTLQGQFDEADGEVKAAEERRDAALRDLSKNESALVQLTTALNERSVLIDSHKAENAALRMQARMLNERLNEARKEARAAQESLDAERRELKAAAQNVMEERSKFEKFHGRVTELVQQVTEQRTADEVLYRSVRKELETRLAEQLRLLNDSQSELIHLRREGEIAHKAEDDLRVALMEKTKLQAALDRANGDRARLVHELGNLKRLQADQSRATERVDNMALPGRVNDIAAERARRAAYRRPSRTSSS